ncbi:MAG: sigma-54 dependent transcriptional regulator [Thermodesulfobacteriota bacterium]
MRPSAGRVLVVDDEKDFCDILFVLFKTEGFEPMVAHNGETALEMIGRGLPDAVLLDVRMPGIDGMEVLRRAKEMQPDLPVLLMTAYGGLDGGVRAIKQGAWDYLAKPIDNRTLVCKLKHAISEAKRLKGTATPSMVERNHLSLDLDEIMGSSATIAKVIQDIRVVAPTNFSVIIQGESGTGKELVARAIHRASLRASAPIIAVDCGAIPETLFESELFGYEKGAFTGAISRKAGRFEMAEGGTLFLDEIGNMPLSCQMKILRAIQERTFFRVGGKDPVIVDVRLLVASNQDLSAAISGGSFKRDLFYRLSEFTIVVPPLRERREDLVHLANRFLQSTNVELNKRVTGFSEEAMRLLLENPWPGNVRQLRSTVRRAVLQADESVGPEHLSLENPAWEVETGVFSSEDESSWAGQSLKSIVRSGTALLERRVIAKVLRKTKGNKAEAARLLQVDYKTLHSKVKQYHISIFPEEDNGQEK